MTLVLRYAARSDRGLVRSNNEDSVYAGARLLALADGMGGHAAGEVASQLVIAALAPLDDDEPGGDLLDTLADAVHSGNAAIADHVRATSFLVRDGVLPSNEGRGYVLRRIMRRAMRHAHMLGAQDPVMHRLVPALVRQMGAAYPEL